MMAGSAGGVKRLARVAAACLSVGREARSVLCPDPERESLSLTANLTAALACEDVGRHRGDRLTEREEGVDRAGSRLGLSKS
jgi:hypothetical protein